MPNPVIITLGRFVQAVATLRGGGSALPGLVVEKLEPNFAVSVLETLPKGVVLVSGTNGKTTTVKIVTELLEACGLRVFTNESGSNFMRGVISSLLQKVSLSGRLQADIAVLELDEAHAVNFVAVIKPHYTLLLNVMQDQTDRFGEVDYTAKLLASVARATTKLVVLNQQDPLLSQIPTNEKLSAEIRWFGERGSECVIGDRGDRGTAGDREGDRGDKGTAGDREGDRGDKGTAGDREGDKGTVPEGDKGTGRLSPFQGDKRPVPLSPSGTVPLSPSLSPAVPLSPLSPSLSPICTLLTSYSSNTAGFEVSGKNYSATLALKGKYNALNAAAALALVHAIAPQVPVEKLIEALARVRSAFGRGESISVEGTPVELILVKNPGGFEQALKSFDPRGSATMITVNDDYGDGRDISWIYDVCYDSLKRDGVAMLAGSRTYDMALCLEYNEVPVKHADPKLGDALDSFLAHQPALLHRIFCSYTTMITLRKLLAAKANLEPGL
ncbi:MAG: MurT ligase domain-containing protein [Coriobacteriia bacterium]|nr:MurT ligase domain-containing protein [Coriobacteriia bacterium]